MDLHDPKLGLYKEVKELETKSPEVFFQDGEREFSKKEEEYNKVYSYFN